MRRRTALLLTASAATGLLATGSAIATAEPAAKDLSRRQRRKLAGYAADTWRSMDAMTDPDSGLPADNIDGDLDPGSRSKYTSPTNVGCYLWSAITARELDLITASDARERIRTTLTTLAELERHDCSGMYYNWYDPATGDKLVTWPEDGNPVHPFLSSVDNAWLATALMIVANDDEELREPAEELLSGMNFRFHYNPAARGPDISAGLFRGGFWPEKPPETAVEDNYGGCGPKVWYTGHHYEALNTETRMIGYVAITLGQVPKEHYFASRRTFEDSCDHGWQEMKPIGEFREHLGIKVFEGAYRYRDIQFVPAWGGSMFEALMPDLFVPEAAWAPKSWGRNHPAFVKGQIAHGMDEAEYGHWGFSPSSDPFAKYREYGVDPMGIDAAGYTSDRERTTVDYGFAGCPDREPKPDPERYGDGVVTPHAVFLALPYANDAAMAELDRMDTELGAYGTGGFYDAVAVRSKTLARRHLSLDQGMIMAALGNALADNVIRQTFSAGAAETALKPLLAIEEFNIPAKQ